MTSKSSGPINQALRGRGRPRFDQEDQRAASIFTSIGESISLNRNDRTPLWIQLKNQIADAIEGGKLAENSRIPSEQALCELFGVSRPVVRAAIATLASEGHVIKMPRKGMFVAGKREDVDFMTSNLGVFGDLTSKGHVVTTRTFEFYKSAPDAEEMRVFGLPEQGTVVRIGRVYLSDGQPITMTRISLPAHKVPGMEKLEIDNRSVFETLKQHYGLTVQRAERWFTAKMPSDEAVERMGVPRSDPLIWIESVAYSHDGEVLEFYRAFYNPAVARIHVTIESKK